MARKYSQKKKRVSRKRKSRVRRANRSLIGGNRCAKDGDCITLTIKDIHGTVQVLSDISANWTVSALRSHLKNDLGSPGNQGNYCSLWSNIADENWRVVWDGKEHGASSGYSARMPADGTVVGILEWRPRGG